MAIEQVKHLMTDAKFQEIYSNEKFRNEVAFAHKHYDRNCNFLFWGTCSYPIAWQVTEAQIAEAKKERNRRQKEVMKLHKNDLVFIGMGMDYKARYEGDVCNYRVRATLKNPEGVTFFVEFSQSNQGNLCGNLYCTASQNVDMEKADRHSAFRNAGGLERSKIGGEKTFEKSIILRLVNSAFNCKFKRLIVDSTNIRNSDFVCESPK